MQASKILLTIIFTASLFASSVAAQPSETKTLKGRLPRVGNIKDYPATGLMTGCGNLYFSLPKKVEMLGEDYVFLAREKGEDAWMNLDGRDTRLTLLKSKTWRRAGGETGWRYDYRAGATRIIVRIDNHGGDSVSDHPFKMIITLRKGRSSRTVKAIGYADC